MCHSHLEVSSNIVVLVVIYAHLSLVITILLKTNKVINHQVTVVVCASKVCVLYQAF